MSTISKIEVELWTRDETYASTDDGIYCIITFMDNRSFMQHLDNPNSDDFEQGNHDLFLINLADTTVADAISGQQETDIKSITIKKINGSNMWKCGAVCIRVNNKVILSREVNYNLEAAGSSFTELLRKNGALDGMGVRITTGTFKGSDIPSTNDSIYFGLKFSDGTYEISNVHLFYTVSDDFEAGSVFTYAVPLTSSAGFNKTAEDIDEITLSKTGDDGWLLKGVELFTNDNSEPVMANTNINQFIDNSKKVLYIQSWSSKRVLGPVLGYISDVEANVQYRVEREGIYRLEVYLAGSTTPIRDIDKTLNPTGIFKITELAPNTHYSFKFYHLLNNQVNHIALGDGSFRTFPAEGSGVKFSFGTGSCPRNRDDAEQKVWTQIKNVSLDHSEDIVTALPDNNLCFFIHSGDTFYFNDDVLGSGINTLTLVETLSISRTAHLSVRLNANFLEMARRVPTFAVWDDHDFSINNADSSNFPYKSFAKQTFLEYWANPMPFSAQYGLSCRLTYGNVDIYLLDGRYNRLKSTGQYFTQEQCNFIVQDMESRGYERLRILVTGSAWYNDPTGYEFDNALYFSQAGYEQYGSSIYNAERVAFYSSLNSLIAQSKIKGLVFVSGDIHQNEIFEVKLAPSGKVVPEIISSPLTKNGGLDAANSLVGERKWSRSSLTGDGWGFASIHIDTRNPSQWMLAVKYRRFDNGTVYYTKNYTLINNQFQF